MSDFLKITTPLVNKNQAVTPKPGTEAVGVLNLANTTKVLQTHNQSEILKQNNGLFEDGTPTLLLNLLKDPGVTATYLQNIGMLEELAAADHGLKRGTVDEMVMPAVHLALARRARGVGHGKLHLAVSRQQGCHQRGFAGPGGRGDDEDVAALHLHGRNAER